MYLFAAALLLFLPQSNDSLLINQTQQQVQQYIGHVQDDKNRAINLWALSVVIEAHPEMRSYLNKYANQPRLNKSLLSTLSDTTINNASRLHKLAFQTKSPLLLTAYILAEPDKAKARATVDSFIKKIGFAANGTVNYQQIVQVLLNKEKITEAMLPAEQFHPLHYFLFYHSERSLNDIFTNDYLHKISQTWSFPSALSLKQAMGISALFKVYYNLSQYNKTLSLYNPILNNSSFPNNSIKIRLLQSLDYSMYQLGYYNRSIDIIRNHAIPLARYLGNATAELQMKIALGTSLYRIGKYIASIQVYSTLLKNDFSTSPMMKIKIFNNLAINYYKTGDFDNYLKLIFKSLELAKQENNLSTQLEILINLFVYYRKSGDFNSARTYLKEAQKIAQKTEDRKNSAQLIFYEGMLYKEFKSDFSKALASFKTALSYLTPQKNYTYFQRINTEIAFIYEKQNHYRQAISQYNQIIARAKERDDIRNILENTVHKANVFLKTGQQDSVKKILDFLASRPINRLTFDHIIKAKTVRAQYLINKGKTKQAIRLLKPALQQVVLRSSSSGDLQTGFWQVEPEYLNIFEVMANLLIDTGQPEEAVEVLDRLKTINDAELYQNPLTRSQVLNEKELSLYKRLTQQLNQSRKDLLTAKQSQQGDIRLHIDELSAQKKVLDLKITTNAGNEPVSVDQIQHRLSAGERVLHITELNDFYYFAIIARNSVHFKKIALTPKVRSLFKTTITDLSTGNTNLNLLYKISQILGLEKFPEYVHRLIILPDSYLYQLPLAALPLEKPTHPYSYGSAHYLIERFEISYKTSFNDFTFTSSYPKETLDFAGYAVSRFNDNRALPLTPLPFADNEVKNISKQLTAFNRKKLLLNNEATEKAFRQFAPNARVVHVATHSMVSSRNPLFSSIFLSSGNDKNNSQYSGRIFAYELFELNLNNDLIMLNSCESASGSYLQGSGVLGISRALRYAGANALMLNLWPVNDMLASGFAVKFYSELNKGLSKSDALRKTQLYFLSHNNANPYYWAPYMLLGNTGPLIQPYKHANKVTAVSFMALFVIFALSSTYLEWNRRKIKEDKV